MLTLAHTQTLRGNGLLKFVYTRMHSSRMRTVRSSSRPVGGGVVSTSHSPGADPPRHQPPPWRPAARHAGIPPAMHAGIAPPRCEQNHTHV